MSSAGWIWKFGDMEKYHNIRVHTRRHNYGFMEPPVWKLYTPDPVVRFQKKVCLEQEKAISVTAQGEHTIVLLGAQFPDGKCPLWGVREAVLPAGEYMLQIRVMNSRTFPALFVDGAVCSDESWLADDTSGSWAHAAGSPVFADADRPPEDFPFEYRTVLPVSVKTVNGGYLYDFGREIYAGVRICWPQKEAAQNKTAESPVKLPAESSTKLAAESPAKSEPPVVIRLGESEEEAMDPQWCVIQFIQQPVNGVIELLPAALRWLFVGCAAEDVLQHRSHTENDACLGEVYLQEGEAPDVSAVTQMLALKRRGFFTCDDPVINDVVNVAEYTFRLNCREFFLDGIKRDGWVWSADTWQSLFVAHYLYMDQELEKRTLTALGGGLPVVQYINTIMDYSYFWLMSLQEYYRTYKDVDYIRSIYSQARAVMLFCDSRRSSDGFIRGRDEDWVFIDWAEMDRTGALLGEQILLAQAMTAFAEIEEVALGSQAVDKDWRGEAVRLRENILKRFYDTELGAFIDSFESGRRFVSRQNNILAYLYLDCAQQLKRNIYENVMINDTIPPITTPYFKFYENQAFCEEGGPDRLEENIRSYYGSMLALGATTLYEQYDPDQTGAEHYSMYGRPFEKSLCHAWSCSPVYLLGRYRLGVVNTGTAYDTYEVRPSLGSLTHIEGTVPLPEGEVNVEAARTGDSIRVSVKTDAPGGTLILGERKYTLVPGATVTATAPLPAQQR